MAYTFSEVFIRAKTSDDRWASVNAADLDERSFRLFLLNALAEAGLFVALKSEIPTELKTPLTKAQAESP